MDTPEGLIDLNHFESGGLQDWLEEIARSYVEDQRYAGIDRSEAREYGEVVLRSGLDENLKQNMLISLCPSGNRGSQNCNLLNRNHFLYLRLLTDRLDPARSRARTHGPKNTGSAQTSP